MAKSNEVAKVEPLNLGQSANLPINNNAQTIHLSRSRLHELFSQIEREFDVLLEENQELRARLGITTPLVIAQSPAPPRKTLTSQVGKLKIKIPKQMIPSQKEIPKWMHLKEFVPHRDGVWEVVSCPWDVNLFATASADRSARISYADGSRASVIYLGHTGSVNSIRFHPTDRLVCTSSGDKTCHIWKLPLPEKSSVNNPSKAGNNPNVLIQVTSGGTSSNLGTQISVEPRTSAVSTGVNIATPNTPSSKSVSPPNSSIQKAKPWTPLLGRERSREDDLLTFFEDRTNNNLTSGNAQSIPTQTGGNSTASSPPNLSGFLEKPDKGFHFLNQSQDLSPPSDTDFEYHVHAAKECEQGPLLVRTSMVELKGHSGPVIGAGWLSSNSVATGSWDNTVRIWNAETERSLSQINSGHDKSHKITHINTNTVTPLVLFSSTDCSFRLWDTRLGQGQGHIQQQLPTSPDSHQDVVTSATFSSDANLIVSGSDDRTVKVWDIRNLKQARTTIRCPSGVNRLSFSSNTSTILVPLDDKRTVMYDINGVRKGKLVNEEKRGHKMMVSSACFSADESVIYTTSFDRRVIAWARELL
eukprot:TRINITY_DN8219_c0_g1_i1.p1 TRINITY_DN8219_c0_g1~~TRINITY_DN8219_c0_g1_i1.p1  ORF type:complete len:585 (-),score=79.76 TRINITY_DN8219_c0_g1_i1:241-1995(-)